ncbi:MAG: hypothetical protein N5P05_001703 [Chroococcopsis gigantea SAG 12.99]|jgi:hypothetical protein|nr:Gfo/Idh/MocA family oxidoreductase [Chlorogloea purpurea SAG 13.99]MDV3000097.1 hypothetical protein [Chroococcopsis gigantea SAG 12.99]
MYNTLLIGSGRRIQHNFLPALICLQDHFKIIGVHSRSEEKRRIVAEQWNIPSISDLNLLDFSTIDVVILSITLVNNKDVIKQLAPHASNLILVIDTPVLPLKDLRSCVKLLNRFKQVVVTEDFMNFPQFQLMRKVITQGTLGNIKKIILEQSGFMYHGLALVRSYLGFESILYSQRTVLDTKNVNINYYFKNKVLGRITEPYKRLDGSVTVIGSKGILTYGHLDLKPESSEMPLYILKEVWDGDNFMGFSVDGPNLSMTHEVEFYQMLKTIPNPDTSHFNTLKTSGLIEVFRSLIQPNFHNKYNFIEGIYDLVVSSKARSSNNFRDFFGVSIKLLINLLRYLF